MAPRTQRVLDEALALPEDDRLTLAAELLGSVAGPPSLDRPDWEEVIVRRAKAAAGGEPGILWAEARERIAGRLRTK